MEIRDVKSVCTFQLQLMELRATQNKSVRQQDCSSKTFKPYSTQRILTATI